MPTWFWLAVGLGGGYWLLRKRAIDLAVANNPNRGTQQQVMPYLAVRADMATFWTALGSHLGWLVEGRREGNPWEGLGYVDLLGGQYFAPGDVTQEVNLLPI